MAVPLRTGGGRIEYNPTQIDGMADSELADRMKVEALRILLKHPYQRQPFRARPEILYLASNMTILDNMGGPMAFCFQLLPQWIVDAMPKGKTFEEYYGLLNRLIPPVTMNVEFNIGIGILGDGGSKGGSDDTKDSDSSSMTVQLQMWIESTALWEEDSIMTVDINLIIQAVMAGPSKGWGTLPANFVECVKASLVPPIDVANILKGFKKSILSQRRDLTRMRPSRRYGFEQMGSKYAYTTRVLVALDVSGSVDSETLSRMLGLINRIFKQGVERIDVLQFDAELKGAPQPIRKAINTFKVLGRGGTDFQPVADYYMNHPGYDGLIYITDGIAPDPEIPVEYRSLPVTWIITDDDLIPSIKHGWKGSIMK
ncbi:MAG: hypothetical protein K2N05_12030 [Muribaculaceae bacterium]|nr:hypothetical protein [Muribaculaceae bacterium]